MSIYVAGSLFDVPKNSILVHACNATGTWGSGIALEFKKRFPKSYKEYHENCKEFTLDQPGRGSAMLLAEENGYHVGCLITSEDYGDKKDPPELILKSTRKSLELFLEGLRENKHTWPIYSNRFNSGLFGVPWEETAKIINEVVTDREWIVMDGVTREHDKK